ncbi:MAG: DUF4012 domain-containing protein [bacterium]|nr:DUF4012 domain-containing protein [bacterium]
MLNDKRQFGKSSKAVSTTDSFIIDLRAVYSKPVAKENARKEVIKQAPIKKVTKKNAPTFSFALSRVTEQVLHKKKKRNYFDWGGLFKSPRRYRWHLASMLRTDQYVFPLAGRRARRRFARDAAVKWRNITARITKTTKSKEKEIKAEHLVTWYRSLFAFVAALIFIILPFKLLAYFKILDFSGLKDNIVSSSFSAFDNLAAASDEASSLDLAAAGNSFGRAASDFSAAQKELGRVDDWLFSLAAFSRDPQIKLAASGKKFLAVGLAGAAFGQHLSAAGEVFLSEHGDRSWGKLIDAFVEHGTPALASARDLQTVLNDIQVSDLPLDYQERFTSYKRQADLAVDAMSTLLNSAQEIKEFIGVSHDKRYLLVFQNNTEMRGSGGFLGSYALVDIRDGRIRKLEVPAGGTYDTEAGMTSYIRSPKPLWLVNPRWYLWDANWWPDWPTTARSLMWFYEKSDGPTVDGVISFTPDVLENLLRITGPIDLRPEYELTVDADTFWELIQATVEKPNLQLTHPEAVASLPDSPKNQPKKIIGDLMAKILERLPEVLTAENAPALVGALEKNLSAKNIMLYFTDPSLQEKVSRYHLDGAMLPAKQDYLLVAHTNIAGQKSDRRMEEKITHSAEILMDGTVIDTLTIHRTHTGIKNEVLTGVRNVDWLRVYVPEGSQLLEASGFDVPDASYFEEPEADWQDYSFVAETEGKATSDLRSGTRMYTENGKTVFANWVMTDPGKTSVTRFRYRLPFKVQKNEIKDNNKLLAKIDSILNGEPAERLTYSLLWQKQPGAKPAQTESKLLLPPTWKQVWNYPYAAAWTVFAPLNRDLMKATLIEKIN